MRATIPSYGLRTRQPEGLGHGRVAEDGVDELLRERAHHAREDHGTGEPAEDRRAVDGGRQPERAAQPCRRPRRSRAPAEQGAAEVAASGDEDGERGEQPADGERDEEGPPAHVPEGRGLLGPAEGREPGDPRLRHVSDAPQHVGHGEDEQAPHVDAPGVQGDLGEQRREPGEDEGEGAEGGGVEDRSGGGHPEGDEPEGERDGGDEDGGGGER